MKIFLMTSPLGWSEPVVYPIGPAYLASHLGGHDVDGYDVNLPGRSVAEGLRRAADFDPDVIALSFRNVDTTMERDLYCYYPPFQAAVAAARETLPRAKVFVGGAAFSLYPRQIMEENAAIDVGVVGEGEETFAAALAADGAWAGVPGLLYREGGRVNATPPAGASDFAAAPPPDRRLFPLSEYVAEPFAVGVQTQRGCPHQCAYCTYPVLEGRRVRMRAPRDVGDELEALRLAGVETFTFVDATWGAPPQRAKDVCREIIRRRLDMKWRGYFGEKYLDDELADLALEAGVAEFTFSPDAADDRVLRALDKDLTRADLYRTLDLVKARPGARASYSFFINPPEQTWRSFADVVRFYLRGKRYLGRQFLGAAFGNVRLEAGTPLHERALAEGKVAPDANLLPRTRRELRKLFYHARPSLKLASRLYVILWRAKQFINRGIRGR